MSVLLLGASGELGEAIVRKLLDQGDEVRAIENEPSSAASLRDLGVHIARGREIDSDLIERAGQNARTLIVIDPEDAVVTEAIEAARNAAIERLIVCGQVGREIVEVVRSSGLQYVILLGTERGRLLRRSVPAAAVAEAVDAADDLAGEPHLELDLTRGSAWKELGLER